jgi:hypothetical protein
MKFLNLFRKKHEKYISVDLINNLMSTNEDVPKLKLQKAIVGYIMLEYATEENHMKIHKSLLDLNLMVDSFHNNFISFFSIPPSLEEHYADELMRQFSSKNDDITFKLIWKVGVYEFGNIGSNIRQSYSFINESFSEDLATLINLSPNFKVKLSKKK